MVLGLVLVVDNCPYLGFKMSGVLLRGLPFEADQDDIKQFFSSLSITHSSIEMIVTYDGKFSGLAFVKLRNPEEIKIALLMDRNHMGGRYIDVMNVSEEKHDQIRKAAGNGLGRRELHRMCGDNNRQAVGRNTHGRGRDNGGRNYGHGPHASSGPRGRSRSPVREKNQDRSAYFNGFPEDVLYRGVRSFFDDCTIGKGCVHLFRGENGRFRGDGYIEFPDSSELRKALRKDGMLFHNRRIDIEGCSQDEVRDNLRFMMDRTGPNAAGVEPDPMYGGYRRREDREDRDYRRGDRDRVRSREGHREGEDRWNPVGYRRHEDKYETHHHYVEDRRHEIDYGHHRRQDPYDDHRSYHLEPEVFGDHKTDSEGRTLRMHGIPPSARTSDIVSFFKNYGVEYEDIRVQCHDDGVPNGRAFITFPSERLSSAAYHDLNRRMMKNAYIELFPV